jgi:hypothetical protein
MLSTRQAADSACPGSRDRSRLLVTQGMVALAIAALAIPSATAGAAGPTASFDEGDETAGRGAERTTTELGQSTGAPAPVEVAERTTTELGQSTGAPAPVEVAERTTTELGQSSTSLASLESSVTSPDDGFEWADAAIGAGAAIALMALVGGGVLVLRRHRHMREAVA